MEPRTYVIVRDPRLGYGFVAGNDYPTVVKHIEPNGPSSNRLLPGDVIMVVNGINVETASRDQIIKMIQLSDNQIEIKVRQITFEEAVVKIFFELGYTRVLNYDSETTVRNLLESLNSRLIESSPYSEQIKRYFGIVLTVEVNSEGKMKAKKLHVLDENDSITKLRQLSYAPSLRLIYRMIHPPLDVRNLYNQDKIAFEYLYQQSCNDLRQERFRPELSEETVLKLSALHLLEHVYTHHSKAHNNSKNSKVYLNLVKEEPGLKHFIPISMAEKIVDKKGKIISAPYKKLKNKVKDQLERIFSEYDLESLDYLPNDQIKLLFLEYLSQLPCYGNSERPPIRTSPSSLTSSLDRTSDSISFIGHDDSVLTNSNSNNAIQDDKRSIQNRFEEKLAQYNSNRYENQFHLNQKDDLRSYNLKEATKDLYSSHTLSEQRLYNSRGSINRIAYKPPILRNTSLDETLRKIIKPPPPPLPSTPSLAINDTILTRVLTDQDIEKLLVPPPPPRTVN